MKDKREDFETYETSQYVPVPKGLTLLEIKMLNFWEGGLLS